MPTKADLLTRLDDEVPGHGLTSKSTKTEMEAELDGASPVPASPRRRSGRPVSLGGMCVER